MTQDQETLAALAARCGIADAYHDIWGGHHPTSTATQSALLTAMHFSAAALADDPAALLAGLETTQQQRRLPAVRVVRSGEAIHIPHALPGWQWQLVLEDGTTQRGVTAAAGVLELPPLALLGYHRIEFRNQDETLRMPLIVVPARCHQPTVLAVGGRVWGLTVQLYGVRSQRNWGIGDFGDLGQLVAQTAALGGALVGLNPLHALFPDNPAHISPYSPSQRSFVNVLYIDIEAVAEFSSCTEAQRRVASADFQKRLQDLRTTEFVDYPGVAQAKLEILVLLFRHFQTQAGARQEAFAAWRLAQGAPLESHARYEALQAYFRAQDGNCWGWPVWPEAYRDPGAAAVSAFAAAHADEVTYYAWLQWLADTQLQAVAAQVAAAGMGIGIYEDLAIGANPGGAEAWRWQEIFATGGEGAHAGAPPDEINLMGQDWGLPPFVPERLHDVAYQPLVEILRANMRHAGALRIDHVMGLMRLFWVPGDMPASEGAYVSYPFEDMLGIVALESVRNDCLVIGEDLGTVPDGFRERLAEAGVLSYHPLIFERYEDGNFRLPADVAPQALVAVSTHDLPTLRGFWRDEDIIIRTRLMLFPNEELRQRLITERGWDRGRLLWALEREGLLPAGVGKDPAVMPEISPDTVQAVHAYLARTPSQLMVVQPEDLLGVLEQANLPGTQEDRHPNWQRKLPLEIECWSEDLRFTALAERLVESGRSSRKAPT